MDQSDNGAPRRVQPRRWTGLGVAAASGLVAAAPILHGPLAHAQTVHDHAVVVAQAAEGGEGGEGGEGAESGSIALSGLAGEAAYLADLGFVEGHLRAGLALYASGETVMAATHMKHPEDEIYADLLPEIMERGGRDFAPELAALSDAVAANAAMSEVDAKFAALQVAIAEARAVAGDAPTARLLAAAALTRTAAEEYGVGLKDGAITDVHEYQDAWGFLQTVAAELDALSASGAPEVAQTAQEMRAALAGTDAAFAGLTPDGAFGGDASLIYGAAARLELLAPDAD